MKKLSWFDLFIYKIWYWRWNNIFANRPDLREIFIANLKAFDTLNEGDPVKVTVTIEKANEFPVNDNDKPVYMHSNGYSTERNVAVAIMRELGLDVNDYKLRDKLIFAAGPWIQAEREKK